MELKYVKLKGRRNRRLLALLLLIAYFGTGYLTLSHYIYTQAENQCIERLRESTDHFCKSFYSHVMNDREQLNTLADMIALTLAEGGQPQNILASYKGSGIIGRIELLLPDGTLITKSGQYNVSSQISVSDEMQKGEYLSNRTKDFIDPDELVVRNAVPVSHNGETVAILYGIIDLSKISAIYDASVFNGQAHLYILEADTGNYILDTWHENLSSLEILGTRTPKKGYNLDQMSSNLTEGIEGYSAFLSETAEEYLYIYYESIGINEWRAMVSVPESVAFAYAYSARNIMLLTAVFLVFGLILYSISMLFSEIRLLKRNENIFKIQAMLLESHTSPQYLRDSLHTVISIGKAKAAFLIDSDEKNSDSITVGDKDLCRIFCGLSADLTTEMQKFYKDNGHGILRSSRKRQYKKYPHITEFFNEHGLYNIVFAPATTENQTANNIIGILNTRQIGNTAQILETVSFSFFMALHNIKHLRKIELSNTTDALTGALNRTSYQDILVFYKENPPDNLGCIYIDVNDLHTINNQYGHQIGDVMLQSITLSLQAVFGSANVYRIGGDEFVIFLKEILPAQMQNMISTAKTEIAKNNYHISLGAEWSRHVSDIESLIRSAEIKMYEAKYKYYQLHRQVQADYANSKTILQNDARIEDINAFLQLVKYHYLGVYFVSMVTDDVREIYIPSYFDTALKTSGNKFGTAFKLYMKELVDHKSLRSVENFFNYYFIERQLLSGTNPTITYFKRDGRQVKLTVYLSPDYNENTKETVWVFENPK